MTRASESGPGPARSYAHRQARGFTLTEIAVAVAILALLLGGLLIPLSTQVELARVRETQRQLEAIREALIGYAVANGRLPCPARPDAPAVAAVAGTGSAEFDVTAGAPYPGRCRPEFYDASLVIGPLTVSRAAGALPWVTLGLPETDAWGRRFTYIVEATFADGDPRYPTEPNPPGTLASCSAIPAPAALPPPVTYIPPPSFCASAAQPKAQLKIQTRSQSGTPAADQAVEVVAYVISHGKNGYYGWRPNGTVDAPPNAGRDEGLRNAVFTGGAGFQAGLPFPMDRSTAPGVATCDDTTGGSALCEFDDQVIGISRSLLIGRMAAAGRL